MIMFKVGDSVKFKNSAAATKGIIIEFIPKGRWEYDVVKVSYCGGYYNGDENYYYAHDVELVKPCYRHKLRRKL